MKKPLLVLLAVAVLFVALLGLWMTLDDSGRGGKTVHADPVAEGPRAAGIEEPVALVPAPAEPAPEVAQTTEEVAEEPVEGESLGERRALPSDASGRRIAGSVRMPAGSPADETLRVLAVSERLQPRNVFGRDGLLADEAEGKKERLLGSASVAPDGRFELALGSAEDVWLLVDGRFLYSSNPLHVPAGEDSGELTPLLGGCLAGRLRLPAEVAETSEVFAGIELELGPDSLNFATGMLDNSVLYRREARPDGEGHFEIRALPVGVSLSLEIETSGFAKEKVGDLAFEPGVVRTLEVALLRGATLRGRVSDEQGRPLGDVEVAASESAMWGFPGDELASGTSDAAGLFEIEHIAEGKCILIASKEGFLDSDGMKLELRDGEAREGLDLLLTLGASIEGRVSLQGGAPVEGASVEVSFDPAAMVGMGAINAARGADGKTRSAGDGTFSVRGLGKGPFVVKASLEREAADGSKENWLARASPIQPETTGLELELKAPSTLRGRVLDPSGVPIPKFTVRATMDSGAFFLPGETRLEAGDDPEGDFVLHDLEGGKWKVEASADGFGPMTPLEVVLPGAERTPLELVLAPAATVAGTVIDPNGVPVGGARVKLQLDGNQRIVRRINSGTSMPEATSKEDGSFLLSGLASGTSSIVATGEGFAASEPVSVEATAEQPATGVLLRMRKGALLTGEVFGKNGKPSGGTQIIAQSSGMFETNMKRTDGTGQFRFEHLTPGSWTVTAMLEDGELEGEGSAAEASASFMENMRFTMVQLEEGVEEHVVLGAPPKDPVVVSGRVKHGNEPVTEGLVSFFAEGAKGLEGMKMAPLGPDGHFETQLGAPGPYVVTVQVMQGGGAFQQNNVEFRETIPEVERHELDFSLPLGSVRGTVFGADHEPLAGTRITLTTEGGIETGSLLGGHYSESTTDSAGRYAFEFLRPGAYAVAAGGAVFGGAFGGDSQAGRFIRAGLRVEEGRTLEGIDFQLEDPGDIIGKVVDASGASVKDAALFVRDSSGHLLDRFSMIVSGADGTFTYSGVAPGEYVVSARGKGMASPESAPVRVEKGGKSRVEIVLYPGTKLEISVVDDEGEPLQARISVLDENGREMQGMLGWAEMASGFQQGFDSRHQTVGPLAPGSYSVTAVTADGRESTRPVTLDGREERRLKIRLR